MRYRPGSPRHGEERQRTAFLWFPKRIGREWRWLERASWVERWELDLPGHLGRYHWVAKEWSA